MSSYRTQARISPARSLELVYAAIDVGVDVNIDPEPLQWVADIILPGAREIARQIIENNIPKISDVVRIPLPSNIKAEVDVATDHLIILLATRN